MDEFDRAMRVSKETRKLNDIFVENQLHREFSRAFTSILSDLQLDIEIADPKRRKCDGIVLYGSSGSGKSTVIDYVLDHHPHLQPKRVVRRGVERITKTDVCAIKASSPASLKSVGQNILAELGYKSDVDPLNLNNKEAHYIWNLVRQYLKKSGVLVLFIDEAQDFIINQNRTEINKVISTLKSLLQDKEWPVCVVLAGMPELNTLVQRDDQLVNRTKRISCTKLVAETHKADVLSIVSHYASVVDIGLHPDLRKVSFVRRLLHASSGDFGKTVQEIIRGLTVSIENQSKEVTVADFAAGFYEKYKLVDAANPYLVPDYLNIVVPSSGATGDSNHEEEG
jgi:type II secretory pathway predicted ATPase ExeA